MRRIFELTAFAVCVCMIASCGKKYPEPAQGSEVGFALSFFQKINSLSDYDENLVVSPYSAGVALSMLSEGAEGETKAQFGDALNGCMFRAENLAAGTDGEVKSANSLWIADDFSPKNRYVNLLQKEYDALVTTQNFSDPATVRAINNWCGENTAGKIDHIIDELNAGDVMVLINALYFNVPWAREFDPQATDDATFYGVSHDTEVPMMYMKDDFRYAQYQGCQMIELPYSGNRYSMFVVLPPANMDVNQVLPYISESVYDAAMDMMSQREVRFRMPRFKLETSLVLNDALRRMGVYDAFTSAADFSGMAGTGSLVLDTVKQKCYIDVTEKGTEAAAVTSAQIRLTSVRTDSVVNMTVDRPFLFFIADNQEGNILFVGKVVNM